MQEFVREGTQLQQRYNGAFTFAELVCRRRWRYCKTLPVPDIEHDAEQGLAAIRNECCHEQCINLGICTRREVLAAPGGSESVEIGAIERAACSLVWQIQIVWGDSRVDSARLQYRVQRHGILAGRHFKRDRWDPIERIHFYRDAEALARTGRL